MPTSSGCRLREHLKRHDYLSSRLGRCPTDPIATFVPLHARRRFNVNTTSWRGRRLPTFFTLPSPSPPGEKIYKRIRAIFVNSSPSRGKWTSSRHSFDDNTYIVCVCDPHDGNDNITAVVVRLSGENNATRLRGKGLRAHRFPAYQKRPTMVRRHRNGSQPVKITLFRRVNND